MEEDKPVLVWDFFVRVFHWVLVIAFTVCYVTEGKPRWVHVNAGYIIAALIPLRVIWGFVGPRYARFSDFVRGPGAVLTHLKEVATLKARRYLGHDPAGGAMIVALLVTIGLTVCSGMLLYGVKDKAGPFAGMQVGAVLDSPLKEGLAFASKKGGNDWSHRSKVKDKGADWLEEVHETLANIALGLVILHIGGVVAVSLQTRENLVASMITGRKKPLPS